MHKYKYKNTNKNFAKKTNMTAQQVRSLKLLLDEVVGAAKDMVLWWKVVREFMTLKKASNSSKEMTPSPFVSMLRKMSSNLLAAITTSSNRMTDAIQKPLLTDCK